MSDVWGELEERLKQKAKSIDDLHEIYHTDYLDSYLDDEPPWFWVRLEDIKEAIQQLKQNYAIIRKDDLASIIDLFKSSPFVLTDPLIRRLEELLRNDSL